MTARELARLEAAIRSAPGRLITFLFQRNPLPLPFWPLENQ